MGKNLFPEDFRTWPIFFWTFPSIFSPVPFQVGIVRQLAHLSLNRALHFVNLACDFILSTWLHLVAFSDEI
jgi:hypothetical protein